MSQRRRKYTVPYEQRFVQIPFWMIDSLAYRHLCGNGVKLLTLLAKRFTGHNNGNIPLSIREAARDLGCCKNHAAALFHTLGEVGFVSVVDRGHFQLKKRHASTYKLNWLPTWDASGQLVPATRDFMSWQPKAKEKQKIQNTGAPHGTDSPTT
jgi:hypothetical protein